MLKNFKWTEQMTDNAVDWYDYHNGGKCSCEHPCVNGNIKIIFYTGGGVSNPKPIVECEHCGERFDVSYDPMKIREYRATELLHRFSNVINTLCDQNAILDRETMIMEEVETFLRELSEGKYEEDID